MVDISQMIANWAPHKPANDFIQAPKCSGGWERWAQVDMAIAWKTVGFDITTEVPCFYVPPGTKEPRADLVVTVNNNYDIVELKAWRYNSDHLLNFYKEQVLADIAKFNKYPLQPPYTVQNWTRWAVGLVTVAGIRNALAEPNKSEAEAFAFVEENFTEFAFQGGTVKFQHELAANGADDGASLIISSWHT